MSAARTFYEQTGRQELFKNEAGPEVNEFLLSKEVQGQECISQWPMRFKRKVKEAAFSAHSYPRSRVTTPILDWVYMFVTVI